MVIILSDDDGEKMKVFKVLLCRDTVHLTTGIYTA